MKRGKQPIEPRLSKAKSGSPLAAAQEYWSEERRRAAKPLPLERFPDAEQETTDDAAAGDEET